MYYVILHEAVWTHPAPLIVLNPALEEFARLQHNLLLGFPGPLWASHTLLKLILLITGYAPNPNDQRLLLTECKYTDLNLPHEASQPFSSHNFSCKELYLVKPSRII